ncbi:hypothetical protein BJ742DRAFT_907385 [Cladochytrium replicatum]|nr:hypothetical protein BJ742DRAFT_907385 [Cladochytrium replicatum]
MDKDNSNNVGDTEGNTEEINPKSEDLDNAIGLTPAQAMELNRLGESIKLGFALLAMKQLEQTFNEDNQPSDPENQQREIDLVEEEGKLREAIACYKDFLDQCGVHTGMKSFDRAMEIVGLTASGDLKSKLEDVAAAAELQKARSIPSKDQLVEQRIRFSEVERAAQPNLTLMEEESPKIPPAQPPLPTLGLPVDSTQNENGDEHKQPDPVVEPPSSPSPPPLPPAPVTLPKPGIDPPQPAYKNVYTIPAARTTYFPVRSRKQNIPEPAVEDPHKEQVKAWRFEPDLPPIHRTQQQPASQPQHQQSQRVASSATKKRIVIRQGSIVGAEIHIGINRQLPEINVGGAGAAVRGRTAGGRIDPAAHMDSSSLKQPQNKTQQQHMHHSGHTITVQHTLRNYGSASGSHRPSVRFPDILHTPINNNTSAVTWTSGPKGLGAMHMQQQSHHTLASARASIATPRTLPPIETSPLSVGGTSMGVGGPTWVPQTSSQSQSQHSSTHPNQLPPLRPER